MEHDWIAIGLGIAAIVVSLASLVLTVLAEERNERNRS